LTKWQDPNSGLWQNCRQVRGLLPERGYIVRLDKPMTPVHTLDHLLTDNEVGRPSPWTWSLPVALYLGGNDVSFRLNGCRVDPTFGLTAVRGHVLMHCEPVTGNPSPADVAKLLSMIEAKKQQQQQSA
jgi:hypothetical protein